MGFTDYIKRQRELAALLLMLVILFNLIVQLPLFKVDPHSGTKSEYLYGHRGIIEAGETVVWNRNLHCGMPQYDTVFWHSFTSFYRLLRSQYFYAFLVILGALGVFFFIRLAGYNLIESLLGSLFYGISQYFLGFLPVWIYGWRLILLLLPWEAYLLIKLKRNGSLIDIALLTLLLILTFYLFEVEIIVFLLIVITIYLFYSFIDLIDANDGFRQFLHFLWKTVLAIFLALAAVATAYIPLFQARNQNALIALTEISIWHLTGAIIIIASLFLLARSDNKRLALYLGIGFLLLADIFVLVRYFPWLDNYQQTEFNDNKGEEIDQFLLADSTRFRIYPIGSEFRKNRWTINLQSIGGKDQFSLARYQKVIEKCLTAEIDKNLEINWNLLKLLNVKYLISNLKIPSNRLTYCGYTYQDQLTLYSIQDTMPYAWFASNWQLLRINNILNQINKPEFDPQKIIYLENEIPEFSNDTNFPPSDKATVSPALINSEYISIHTSNDNAGLLVISEIFDEQNQWQAYIDSVKTAIYPVDYALRGIVTPPGEHVVEMRYEPQNRDLFHRISYWSGMMILILFLSEVIFRLWLRLLLVT